MILCCNLADWSQIISQWAIAITGIIMSRLAYLTYFKPPIQLPLMEIEDVTKNNEIIIFNTKQQKTRLIAYDNQLKCYLTDKKTKKDELQWVINREEVQRIFKENDIHIFSGNKPLTGLICIGNRKNWLYSKYLFPDPDSLKNAITLLLKKII